jgi:hypothetical protein
MRNRSDRVLIAALAVLVVVVAATALRHGRGSSETAPPALTGDASLPRAPVPERVRLVPSSTAFLPRCANASIRLTVGPGPVVSLRYAGRPCHVPPLHLHAVLRAANGDVTYAGPALSYEDLSGNYAGEGAAHGPLLGACRTRSATAVVTGSGLSASGSVSC